MSTRQQLKNFLIVYHPRRDVVEVTEYADPEEATNAYQIAEKDARESDEDRQVVLIASDSIETIQRTHSNFWSHNELERLVNHLIATQRPPSGQRHALGVDEYSAE